MLCFRNSALSLLQTLLLFSSAAIIFLLLLLYSPPTTTSHILLSPPRSAPPPPTTPSHLLFGIASSARSWPRRNHLLRLWWLPSLTRGFVFLDSPLPLSRHDPSLPPTRVSGDASRFPYTFPKGSRSAVRIARILNDLLAAAAADNITTDIRWVVLGDDDTVFFPENLAVTLAKYDWERWHYVGSPSESVDQNAKYSFGMAFGGGGIAISYPLARVLATVLDSCLARYGHLYGSDARIFACLAELGVSLTPEPGFHQVDMRGNLFGLLSAHPLTPLVSLHHLDYVDPLFPGMNRSESLEHLFVAVNVDPARVLQQTVCYDRLKSRTISVSWGYAVQVFEGNQLLPDLLRVQHTFSPWKRSRNISSGQYMLNTREFPKDPCKRPAVFYLESVSSDKNGTESTYNRHVYATCEPRKTPTKTLQQIKVYSKLDKEIGKVMKRHCCDTLPSASELVLEVYIKNCYDNELIAMHP